MARSDSTTKLTMKFSELFELVGLDSIPYLCEKGCRILRYRCCVQIVQTKSWN